MKLTNILRYNAICILCMAFATTASARSWRIHHDTNHQADFTDINAACASSDVQDGDTLYLDPGCRLTSQNVSKQLTIIGHGYFLTNRPYMNVTFTNWIDILAEGSKVIGIECPSIHLRASNVIIERCKANEIYSNGSDNAPNAIIRQCFCSRIYGVGSTESRTGYWTIENCIIVNSEKYDMIKSLYYPTIRNNYIANSYSDAAYVCLYNITNGTITNNIIMRTHSGSQNAIYESLSECAMTGNLLSCDAATVASAYPDNTTLDTHEASAVFALTESNDRQYKLKDGSPAIAIEAGPAYGAHPYVYSGLPVGVPYYTKFAASSRAVNDKIKVSLNIHTQDE